MSNQLVITSGAKVRNLSGVLTGTSGVVSSVPYGGANGVATLDSSGKVPLSQLPASVITYLGTWNAATNTPTLTNGVGDTGDLYICNVAGTVNFGAGPITFAVGDWVIYSGTTWEKSGGASGTVTSVAMTVPTGLSVTGSPITTSGTLAVDLAAGYTIPTTSFLQGLVPYTGATQDVNLGTYGLLSDYVGFNTTPSSVPTTQGTLSWNADKESLDLIMNGVTGSLMQDSFYNVKNQTGATIPKGKVVKAVGTVGASGRILIDYFLADGSVDSKYCIGVTAENIADGDDGKVLAFGALRQIDTSAFANGTILYASPTVDGAFTSTEPSNPNNIITVAIVVYSNSTNGEIFVRPTFVPSEADLINSLGYTPADAALVVPYTGATTNVDLGSYGLTGYNLKSLTTFNTDKILLYKSGYVGVNGFQRWFFNVSGAESTGNLGSDLYFQAGDDAGTILYTVASFKRDSGVFRLEGNVNYSGTIGGHLLLKHTIDTFAESGYTSLVSTGSNLRINSYSGSSKIAEFSLSSLTTGAIRTYTLPDASGTVALTSDIPSLSGYVPYTGATSSLNLGNYGLTAASIVVASTGTNAGQILLKQGSVFTTPDGYGTFGSGNANNFYFYQTSSSVTRGARLSLAYITGGATRTYTLQDADGTLAFTSDIPSLTNYVTLNTLQTITGVKFFDAEASFDSNIVLTGGDFVIGNSGFDTSINTETLTASRSINFPNKSGVVAMTSDIPSLSGYVQGSGTTNYHAKFTASGTIGNSMLTDDGTTLQSIGATRSNLYLKAASNSYYSQLAFTNGSNGSFGGISYNNSGQYMQFETNSSEWMRLTSDGKLGIGTTNPQRTLEVVGTFRNTNPSGSNFSQIYNDATGAWFVTGAYPMMFETNGAERMRIAANGYTHISNNGTYLSSTGTYHEFNQSANDTIIEATNRGSAPYGMTIRYANAAPAGGTNEFIYCVDSSAPRFKVNSNGNTYNVTGVFTSGVSDIRYKEQVVDANSQWNDIKSLRVVNFKFIKDVEENGEDALRHIGFIAQQVEEVSPSLVEEMTDRESQETWKTIKTSIIHTKAIKALQEAMARIEELEAKVSALENKS